MAKCLKNKNTQEIKRFTEKTDSEIKKIMDLVKAGEWQYCSKKEWKQQYQKKNEEKESNKTKKNNKTKNKTNNKKE